MDEDQYYLQDSRSYVGNDVLWWAMGGNGYTTDLNKAQVFTKDGALKQHNDRNSDIPWPKSYIDKKVRPAVDMQYLNRKEALADTGIVLQTPRPVREPLQNCHACGKFLRRRAHDCGQCGADNRP